MSVRLVDKAWRSELAGALEADSTEVRIICPFIKDGALRRLLGNCSPSVLQVVTRFNLSDFAAGVSDTRAMAYLVDRGAEVRGVRNLHAKLYLFGSSRAVVTSANLTNAALSRNHEFGVVSDEPSVVLGCRDYFDEIWSRAGPNLSRRRIEAWDAKLSRHLARGAPPNRSGDLPDEGVDVGIEPLGVASPVPGAESSQAFVKFLGEGSNRVPLSFSTSEEVLRAGCHWALGYPEKKRPRTVKDGAVMFIARLTSDPTDIRVFGKATGLQHRPGRDDATPVDIAHRPWKETWPRYIRVHNAEFLSGTMANGVSLNEMMNSLGALSFAATKRNLDGGSGNTDPGRAYRQQAAVELSAEGLDWLSTRLEAAFSLHGKLVLAELQGIDWPELPDGQAVDRDPLSQLAED